MYKANGIQTTVDSCHFVEHLPEKKKWKRKKLHFTKFLKTSGHLICIFISTFTHSFNKHTGSFLSPQEAKTNKLTF